MCGDRQGYLILLEGEGVVSDGGDLTQTLDRHDAAEVFGPMSLSVAAPNANGETVPPTHVLLVEMAFTGPGRSDI